ncbi:hypothetical protein Ahy_B01g052555 [Arachis hypogaea]|uniref:Transposase MuDR plant domain-containing protein n=1 Tax=Arachis hypogaea TaxID=3818 RepID=A0A445APR6_ARAHY|nr:hypothetical protein Ahy_B01g052555 [Arachis hypogaea]
MEFETLSHFRKVVRKFNINIGRSIFFARCDSTRSKAICYDEDCPWQIYCAKRTFPASYQVKIFVNEHTCSRDNHCKSADGKWVIDELEERIRVQPNLTQPQPMPPPLTAQPQPPTNNATTRKQVKRRSVKRPPPTGQTQLPTTPPTNQPTTTPSTHNSQTTPHPLQGASAGTSTRFMQFMPTPGVVTPTVRGRGTADGRRGQGRGRGRIYTWIKQ